MERGVAVTPSTTRRPDVEVEVVPIRREFALSDVVRLRRAWRYFRRRRFDFVQTHTPKASFLGLPAARLSGTTAIYTIHGALYFRDNSRRGQRAGLAVRALVLRVGRRGARPEPRGRGGPAPGPALPRPPRSATSATASCSTASPSRWRRRRDLVAAHRAHGEPPGAGEGVRRLPGLARALPGGPTSSTWGRSSPTSATPCQRRRSRRGGRVRRRSSGPSTTSGPTWPPPMSWSCLRIARASPGWPWRPPPPVGPSSPTTCAACAR